MTMQPPTHGTLGRFARTKTGSIGIMFGMFMPILAMTSGVAVDYGRAVAEKSAAQRTLDATVLMLARSGRTDAEIRRQGPDRFRQALAMRGIDTEVSGITIEPGADGNGDGNGDTVTGTARIETKAMFLGIIGRRSIGSGIDVTAQRPDTSPHEIALVLDVSGSMTRDLNGKTRLRQMQDAVAGMFSTLDTVLPANADVALALVPYSSSVNITDVPVSALEARSLSGLSTGGGDLWAAERLDGSGQGTRRALGDTNPLVQGVPFLAAAEFGDQRPVSRLAPLTRDRAAVATAVEHLVAGGGTAGHIGMAWGLYSLSPNWSSVWAEDPAAYGAAQKSVVILTDGEFNTTHNFGGTNYADRKTSFRYFQRACDRARAEEIAVYAVALSLDATSAAELRECAEGTGGAMIPANSANELKRAFESIAEQIGKLRLSS